MCQVQRSQLTVRVMWLSWGPSRSSCRDNTSVLVEHGISHPVGGAYTCKNVSLDRIGEPQIGAC